MSLDGTPGETNARFLAQDEAGDSLLHRSIRDGTLWEHAELISEPDLQVRNKYGDTPVHEAALYGQLGTFAEIITPQHLTERDHDGFAPIHFAAMYGNLAQLGCHLNMKLLLHEDSSGKTPVYHSIGRGQTSDLQEVFEIVVARAETDKTLLRELTESLFHFSSAISAQMMADSRRSKTLLHAVAEKGELAILRPFLSPELLLLRDSIGQTTAHIAAASGRLWAIEDLLTTELLSVCGHRNQTVAFMAASNGHLDTVPQALITPELVRMADSGNTSLAHEAASCGQLWCIPRELLTQELLMTRNNMEATVMHAAARSRTREPLMVELFTDQNLAQTDMNSNTVAHALAVSGGIDLVPPALLKFDLLNRRNKEGLNVWHVGARNRNLKQFPELTEEMLGKKDRMAKSAAHHAAESGCLDQIADLLTPELVALVDKKGDNLLHAAARAGHLDQVPLHLITPELLEATNKQGFTVAKVVPSKVRWKFEAVMKRMEAREEEMRVSLPLPSFAESCQAAAIGGRSGILPD